MKRIFSVIGKQPWRSYFDILLGKQKESGLRANLIRGSAGTFALKIGAVLLGFALSISLTRLLGSHGYGIYAYAMAWVSILAIVTSLGMHGMLIREVAIYKSNADWGHLKGIISFSTRTSLIVSLLLCALGFTAINFWGQDLTVEVRQAFWVTLLLIPFAALMRLRQATMLGLQHAIYGQLPDMIAKPGLMLIFVWALALAFHNNINSTDALILQLVVSIAILALIMHWLQQVTGNYIRQEKAIFDGKLWITSAIPLFFVECMQIINSKADVAMLGALENMRAVGIYSVAVQVSGLVTFILISVNAALSPAIAQLYSKNDFPKLQKIITKSARLVLFLSLPIALFLLFYGEWVLKLFGREFPEGYMALAILVFGQIINAAMGSVGVIMVMTGNEKTVTATFTIAAFINLTLNAILIPQMGIEGAAIATATSMAIWNIMLMLFIRERLGLDATALGLLRQSII